MRNYPQWATPQRRGWLAFKLAGYVAQDTQGFELDMLSGQIYHPDYDKLQDMLRHEWVADDREERAHLRRLERERMHPRKYFRQGGFDSLMREIYLESQPAYHLEAVGLDALRGQPVAQVRLASSPVRLWVDIPNPPVAARPSRNALRKARRYHKGRLAGILAEAVSDYKRNS